MALQYPYQIQNFEEVLELPDNLIEEANRYRELKLTPYDELSANEKNEMHTLAEILYPYCIHGHQYNQLFTVNNNLQQFIGVDFPTYVNSYITELDKEVDDAKQEYEDLRDDLTGDFMDWFLSIKNNIMNLHYFDFDNPIMLEKVTVITSDLTKSPYTETIKYNNTTIATRTTTITSTGSTERTIVYDIVQGGKMWDKTITTVISGNTVTETVTNNI